MVTHPESCHVWIGLDDTDNPDSGCTTATFDDLLTKISQLDGVEIIERRLVRLWPFAERRTRGNGALACILKCYNSSISILEEFLSNFFKQLVIELNIEKNSLTSPALLYSFEQPDESLYWEAVRHKVDIKDRRNSLDKIKILSLVNSDWGLILSLIHISEPTRPERM